MQTKLSIYLEKVDSEKQKKIHTLLLYMSCEVQSTYSKLEGTKVNLQSILDGLVKSAEEDKFTSIRNYRGTTYFDGPMYVAISKFWRLSLSDLESLFGGINLETALVENPSHTIEYDLISASIRGNFIFINIIQYPPMGILHKYIIINSYGEVKVFSSIHDLGDKLLLVDDDANTKQESYVLDVYNNETFSFDYKITDLELYLDKDLSWNLIYLEYEGRLYGFIENKGLYDFNNNTIIEIDNPEDLGFISLGNIVRHNDRFYRTIENDKRIEGTDTSYCVINEIIFSKNTNRVTFGSNIEGYCNFDSRTTWHEFSYTSNYLEGSILSYYKNIEEQNLERAFEYKYIGSKDWDSEYEKFKNLYTLDENVEINILNIEEVGDYRFNYRVELKYESGKIEKFDVVGEVLSGMTAQIKTISVEQVK